MKLGWILSLFFIGLLSSQSLIDLFATLNFIGVVILWWRSRKTPTALKIPVLGIEKLFLIWLVVILAGLLLNRLPETPWLKSFLEFRWMLELYTFVMALMWVNPKEEDFKKLLPVLAVASVYAIVVYFLKYDLIHENWAVREKNLELEENLIRYRTGGLLFNPMPFAHTYGPLGLLFLGPLLFKEHIRKNKFWIFTVAITLLAVFFSYTRGVWVGMSAAVIAMGFLINKKMGFKVLSGLIVVLGVLVMTVAPVRERVLYSLKPTQTTDTERIILWKANWHIFAEHPLLGIGYGENSNRLRPYYDKMGLPEGQLESHAHNQYLHFLAGTGFIGFLIFLILISWMLKSSYKSYIYFRGQGDLFFSGLALGLIGAQICFYVSGFTESNFSIAKNRYMILLVWALGCWLSMKSRSSQKEKNV